MPASCGVQAPFAHPAEVGGVGTRCGLENGFSRTLFPVSLLWHKDISPRCNSDARDGAEAVGSDRRAQPCDRRSSKIKGVSLHPCRFPPPPQPSPPSPDPTQVTTVAVSVTSVSFPSPRTSCHGLIMGSSVWLVLLSRMFLEIQCCYCVGGSLSLFFNC